MIRYDWRPFLAQWSAALVNSSVAEYVEIPESGWMGYPPASDEQIRAAEQRLGTTLPPSYREFLQVTNGWRTTGDFIDRLWSAEEIAWFSVRNQSWIDAWNDPQYAGPAVSEAEHRTYGPEQDSAVFRAEYLKTTLEISDIGDSAILLLNPQVITEDGEWEAWMLANWLPGASRYRSFWDLMHAMYEDFVSLETHERKRFKPSDAPEKLPHKLDDLIDELRNKAQQWQGVIDATHSTDGYNAAIKHALEEAAQTIDNLRSAERDPGVLMQRVLALADALEAAVCADAATRISVVDILRMPLMSGKVTVFIQQKGEIEGKREAAGIIRWFFA
jgi:hypothetical protein